ncbi:MAG: hypothetical protein IIU16_04660, partial [Bacteroidales bacterium]|nr:hypothetical protein [Bacteroidales bacterium]
MKGRVPARIAKARASHLEELQSEITASHLQSYVGKEVDVLVEEIIEAEDEGLAIGRAWFQAPEVDGSVVIRYDLEDAEVSKALLPGSLA